MATYWKDLGSTPVSYRGNQPLSPSNCRVSRELEWEAQEHRKWRSASPPYRWQKQIMTLKVTRSSGRQNMSSAIRGDQTTIARAALIRQGSMLSRILLDRSLKSTSVNRCTTRNWKIGKIYVQKSKLNLVANCNHPYGSFCSLYPHTCTLKHSVIAYCTIAEPQTFFIDPSPSRGDGSNPGCHCTSHDPGYHPPQSPQQQRKDFHPHTGP